ncbi:hypothetical protein BUALT_Bualt02G0141600 [Buddleja alternifolia]|uniref:PARP n=1 Tax=Buddleja alternifolia TaxID=168488 RepID=A0AAV6Y8Q3_9LAMI|nr:hypothetical protein BUALT_Bualt02G0141600 [Buddleja alternifolia]
MESINDAYSKRLKLQDEYYHTDSCPSDCESGISGAENEQNSPVFDNGLIRIREGETIHEIIKKKLVSSLSAYGFNARIESIYRNDYAAGIIGRAKHQCFSIYSKAMEIKCGGNANVKYAWYCGSRDEINRIISHGFGLPMSNGVYGQGVHLAPIDHPHLESMQSSDADQDGLRHMILCRVILGKREVICPGSEQYNPSSEEFDSGVDNLVSPRKYIIWSSRMNTHILPEFVVSFRGFQRILQPPRTPQSDWMPFANLINALSKFLPPDATELIVKHHSDYKKQKITRHDLIQRVRHIAGDNLLTAIIKSFRGKMKASRSSALSSLQVHLNRRN